MRRTTLRAAPAAVAVGAALAAFATVLVLVVTDWPPLRRLDLHVAADLNAATAPHPAVVSAWRGVSVIGQPLTFQVLAVLTAVALWRLRRVTSALFTAVTVLLAGLVSNVVKWSVGRERPTVADPIAHAAGSSFPSGHALSSCAAVTVLLLVGLPMLARRWRAPVIAVGVLVVALVGVSRLALGVHYVSDVAAGWLLGLAWALAAHLATTALSAGARRAPAPAAPDRPRERPAE